MVSMKTTAVVAALAIMLCAGSVANAGLLGGDGLLGIKLSLNLGGLVGVLGSVLNYLLGCYDTTIFTSCSNTAGLTPMYNDLSFKGIVFVPTDAAWKAFAYEHNLDLNALIVAKVQILDILKLHIVVGSVYETFPYGETALVTLHGEVLHIVNLNGRVYIRDAYNRIINVAVGVKVGQSIIYRLDNVPLPSTCNIGSLPHY